MKPILLSTIFAVGLASGASAATATFFGEDLNNNASVPLAVTPNASGAEADFLSNLSGGVGTEDFESQSGPAPLALSFPGSTGSITANLTGGNGSVQTVIPGTTNAVGRYAISGSNYWDVEAGGGGSFIVEFSTAVSAFGFYGIDIGDFGGQLELELAGGTTQTIAVPTTEGSNGSTDGSVFYFGLIQTDPADAFTSVSFVTTTGGGDFFGFDDLTIGDLGQVELNPVPLPAAGWMLIAALGGLGIAKRRKTA